MPAPRLRCLVVGATVAVAAASLSAVLLPIARESAAGLDGALVRLAASLAILASGWLAVVTEVVVVEARRTAPQAVRGVPAPVRRLVLAACGVAVSAALAAPAGAAPDRAGPGRQASDPASRPLASSASALTGLPLPDRAEAPAGTSRTDAVITVAPGDTLWDLAARHLGDAARWPELHAANRAAIGPDPDLIRPAQRLHVPADSKEHR